MENREKRSHLPAILLTVVLVLLAGGLVLVLRPDRQAAPAAEEQKLVVIYGDARAAVWPPPDDLPGYRFLARRAGMGTTANLLNRFDEHFRDLQPDVIVIQGGVDDLKNLSIFPWRKAEIIAEAKSNLADLVEKARATGATVILTTIIPAGPAPAQNRLLWTPEIVAAMADVDEHLGGLAAPGVLLLDTSAALADEHGVLKPQYTDDYLYLNEEGYSALNAALREILEKTTADERR